MKDPINLEALDHRNVDRKKVKEKRQVLNQVLSWIVTESIFETNLIILAGTNGFSELAGK